MLVKPKVQSILKGRKYFLMEKEIEEGGMNSVPSPNSPSPPSRDRLDAEEGEVRVRAA